MGIFDQLQKVITPVTDTYHAAAQLAGAEPTHQTALRGGAYEQAPRMAARLAYDVSGAGDVLRFMTDPNFQNAVYAAMALPVPGAKGPRVANSLFRKKLAARTADKVLGAKLISRDEALKINPDARYVYHGTSDDAGKAIMNQRRLIAGGPLGGLGDLAWFAENPKLAAMHAGSRALSSGNPSGGSVVMIPRKSLPEHTKVWDPDTNLESRYGGRTFSVEGMLPIDVIRAVLAKRLSPSMVSHHGGGLHPRKRPKRSK